MMIKLFLFKMKWKNSHEISDLGGRNIPVNTTIGTPCLSMQVHLHGHRF